MPEDIWNILPVDIENEWVYGVDGKWLGRLGVFLLHRNITTRQNMYWSFWPSESYIALSSDLSKLTSLLNDHIPVGAISDWKGAIVSAVASQFGPIPHQRCLIHTTRLAKLLLPLRSPMPAVRILREIAGKIDNIESSLDISLWFEELARWYEKYEYLLKEKTIGIGTKKKWWYTHGHLRRGWRLLTHNSEPFFQYFHHDLIPKSNNHLEGTISQATAKLRNHRGMKLSQQISFLNWYFVFSRVKIDRNLKQLWDVWRKKK